MYMKNRDTVVTTIIRWSGFKDTVTLLGSLDRVRNGYSRRRHRRVEATDSSTSSLWQMLGATHSQRATCSCPHPGPPCASGSTNPAPSFHQQCIHSFLEQEVHVIHVWHHKIKQNLGNLLSKFIGIWMLLQLLQLYWSSYVSMRILKYFIMGPANDAKPTCFKAVHVFLIFQLLPLTHPYLPIRSYQ